MLRKEWDKYLKTPNISNNNDIKDLTRTKLKSQKPRWPDNISTYRTIEECWKEEWDRERPYNYELIGEPDQIKKKG